MPWSEILLDGNLVRSQYEVDLGQPSLVVILEGHLDYWLYGLFSLCKMAHPV